MKALKFILGLGIGLGIQASPSPAFATLWMVIGLAIGCWMTYEVVTAVNEQENAKC